MPIEITTALIAFLGVILGFGVTFLLQLLQRRWSLDDQRRDWKRGRLIELSKFVSDMADSVVTIFMMGQVSDEDLINQRDAIANNIILIAPSPDEKLSRLYEKYIQALPEFIECAINDKENYDRLEKFFDNTIDIGTELQERINILIEETYK